MDKYQDKSGTLYLVGTPIGNLEDITLRAIRILKEADIVAAEDTRRTLGLLNHLGIKKKLISYHEHNKRDREPAILEALEQGNNVALVTDAGMPGISDPGEDLAASCLEAGFLVTVVPGPTAVTAALAVSGLDTDKFYFGGFFPRRNKDRIKCLESLAGFKDTIVFYESPFRLLDALNSIKQAWGDRRCCVARELTKTYEEINRGRISEVYEQYSSRKEIKGEFTLLIEGAGELLPGQIEAPSESEIMDCFNNYLRQGMTKKDAGLKTASSLKINKKTIYKLIHRAGKESD